MRYYLFVFAATLLLLAALIVLSGKKSQDAKETVQQVVVENQLTKKQVKQAEQVIAQQFDSIRTQTIIIEKIVHVRDSLKVVAKAREVTADSLLKSQPDEDYTAPTVAAARVEKFLSGYTPKAYARGAGTDSLK